MALTVFFIVRKCPSGVSSKECLCQNKPKSQEKLSSLLVHKNRMSKDAGKETAIEAKKV